MISGIGNQMGLYPAVPDRSAPAQDGQKGGAKELTTVTTHCGKNHRHTPDCPHTVYTRTVDEAQRRGEYIDLYV